ncbi:nucleoid-associated protein [bacterium BMS3Bbin11]|nr:nucleoid-associated protein [bacterium BMS3Abin11]GBE46588.1 nucleoid-associated protein [bacterium BMS3Bbin11]GMT39728.1 MAG: nucleoid-associated protein [bacterium]HDH08542.1 YbaB/EbfC family nucleoid-associated protein [Gammaproteobacteria bacterium]HDH15347.1 YbaB/EbfC family nucleoid-associated protein [Gammaproteobacteria bacterium]
MKGGLGNIMKQAQAMQEKMQQAQEELAHTEVEGSAGGGLVSVTMTCRHDVRKVVIDDELLSEEKAVLEDLVAAALNDAVRKVESTTQEKMSGMTAGMGLPDGMNLPF